MIKKLQLVQIFLLCFGLSSSALTKELDVQGFLTFTYSVSDSEIEYKRSITEDGEFSKGTIAGIQFSSKLSRYIDAYVQMLADGKGRTDGRDFGFDLDIAHINYNYANQHRILYGKIRLPVYMISDYQLVGSLYPWISPPDEVYSTIPLDEIGANNTFFGISFEGTVFNSGLNEVSYRLYTGGSEAETEREVGTGIAESRIKSLVGGLLKYSNSDFEFRFNTLMVHSEGEFYDFENDIYIENQNINTSFSTVGLRYDNDYVQMMAEFVQANGETRDIDLINAYYVTVGSYVGSNGLVHMTYSDVLNSTKSSRNLFQSTVTTGFNLNLDLSTVFKLEHRLVRARNRPKKIGDPVDDDRPAGLFEVNPEGDVQIFSVSINTMF